MFTEQVSLLENMRGQVPEDLITILKQLLGNCSQDLKTRGTLDIDVDGRPAPIVPYPTTDPVYSAFHSYNKPSYMSADIDDGVVNGFAGDFAGVVRLKTGGGGNVSSSFVSNIGLLILNQFNLIGAIWANVGTATNPVGAVYSDTFSLGGTALRPVPLVIYFTVNTVVAPQPTYQQLLVTYTIVSAPGSVTYTPPQTTTVYIPDGLFPNVAVGDKGFAFLANEFNADPPYKHNYVVFFLDSESTAVGPFSVGPGSLSPLTTSFVQVPIVLSQGDTANFSLSGNIITVNVAGTYQVTISGRVGSIATISNDNHAGGTIALRDSTSTSLIQASASLTGVGNGFVLAEPWADVSKTKVITCVAGATFDVAANKNPTHSGSFADGVYVSFVK